MTSEHTPGQTQRTQPPVEAREVLHRHGVTLLAICRACQSRGINWRTVYRVFDPTRAPKVRHGTTVLVRRTAERLLRERGWQGEPRDLWGPLDAPFEPEQRAA